MSYNVFFRITKDGMSEFIRDYLTNKMIQCERDDIKRSQHRNMRILSITPEFPIPAALISLIASEPIA